MPDDDNSDDDLYGTEAATDASKHPKTEHDGSSGDEPMDEGLETGDDDDDDDDDNDDDDDDDSESVGSAACHVELRIEADYATGSRHHH